MTEPSQDLEQITLEAELVDEDAEQVIANAVRGRQAIARKYVRWVRRRHPDATPAEIIKALERHYVTAVSVAGGIVTAGSLAVDFIPGGGGAATKGVKAAGRSAWQSPRRRRICCPPRTSNCSSRSPRCSGSPSRTFMA